jgi:hypothetical protein
MDGKPMNDLAEAIQLLRDRGYEHAAFLLGKAWAEEIAAKRKPRKKMVEVKLAQGGAAWIEKGQLGTAIDKEG